MPPFSPGEVKTAIAPITAKPSGMSCEAELFLGPDELTKVASSGRVPFVSTGAAKNVNLPITMPAMPATYHGYIDVFAGGMRFLTYILTEDVVIAPAYKVSVSFRRERVCITSRGDECLQYSPYERQGTVTVTNQGAPGQLMTTVQGYTHWAADYQTHKQCELMGLITGGQWTDYFATGQVKTYRLYYIVGSTGMPIDSRFFIKVFDPDGKTIAEVDYILPL